MTCTNSLTLWHPEYNCREVIKMGIETRCVCDCFIVDYYYFYYYQRAAWHGNGSWRETCWELRFYDILRGASTCKLNRPCDGEVLQRWFCSLEALVFRSITLSELIIGAVLSKRIRSSNRNETANVDELRLSKYSHRQKALYALCKLVIRKKMS